MHRDLGISVVIPCFNEEENIFSLWDELYPVLESLNISWEVIFVDDCSSDSTAQKIRDINREEIILLSHNSTILINSSMICSTWLSIGPHR